MSSTWSSVYRLLKSSRSYVPKAKLLSACSQDCVIPRTAGQVLGVVRKVEALACVASSQEFDSSLLGDLEEGQSKAAALLFSPLCKQRCSLAFVHVWSLELSTLSVPVPQQAEEHSPFPPVPSRDGHGNYWMSELLQEDQEGQEFWVLHPCWYY